MPNQDDQGPTYDCGPFAVRQWVEGDGFDNLTSTSSWQRWIATANSQRGVSFDQERTIILSFYTAVGGGVFWYGDNGGYLYNTDEMDAALADGWNVIVGVKIPGYQHFLCVYGKEDDGYDVRDSFENYDHEPEHPSLSFLRNQINQNWTGGKTVGVAFKKA